MKKIFSSTGEGHSDASNLLRNSVPNLTGCVVVE